MTEAAPRRSLPGYSFIELLGRGAMGEVWRAARARDALEAAVKVLLERTEPLMLVLFERESAVLATLRHRGIVQFLDRGEQAGLVYLAMQYVQGTTLMAEMAKGPVPPARAAAWTVELSDALDYLHGRGVIHRDLKPSNIVLGVDGRPRIIDFGIASIIDPAQGRDELGRLTLGTRYYVAPEQAAGQPVDGRADIYSLGLVLIDLLTGGARHSMERIGERTTQETLSRTDSTSLRKDLEAVRPAVDPGLVEAALRAATPERAERFQYAADFRDALRPFAEGSEAEDSLPRCTVQAVQGTLVSLRLSGRPSAARLRADLKHAEAALAAAQGKRAILYEIEPNTALDIAECSVLVDFHARLSGSIGRIGFLSGVPSVRGRALVVLAANGHIPGEVLCTPQACRRWLEREGT